MSGRPQPASSVESARRGVGRRAVLAGSAASVLAAAGFRQTPADADSGAELTPEQRRAAGVLEPLRLTVLGTTDLHGNVFNWDYYADAEFDEDGDDVGLAKISTLVSALREQRGEKHTLLIDAGDTIQGTPLTYYYARIEPITKRRLHPMAAAMNHLRYDAAALGNHEFNYGIPLLRTWQDQLDFPLLGANAIDASSEEPAFPPYVTKVVSGGLLGPIRVGILGLTNPGIAIWDKNNVDGKMTFPGLVEHARLWVPRMRRAGADVVVVAAHSGVGPSSSYGDALPYPENACQEIAEEVPGIDAILVGHAHVEIAEKFVTNRRSGKKVLLTEPLYWGKRLSVLEFDLRWAPLSGWRVEASRSQVLNSNTVEEDPEVTTFLRSDHDRVVTYVNSKVGTCKEAMSAATAVYEDTAALDFINAVQADAVKASLEGADAELPVLSIAAPFNRKAAIPAGDVTVRDVAGLYIFDNTLLAIKLTGAQVKAYLEKSAEYFKRVEGPGPHPPDDVTNAPSDSAPDGTPDYNYDVMGGLDAPLTYDVDIAKGVGERIVELAYDGQSLGDDQQFVIAINNYRQTGGGSYPHVTEAEVVYNEQVEIRQLLIDWVDEHGEIDPATFASTDWRLVAGSEPVVVES